MFRSSRALRSGAVWAAGLLGFAWCAVVLAMATEEQVAPRDGRCDRCGGCDAVLPTCVVTHTEREITKVCWGYRCEQVCIPGPSIFCGMRRHRDDCGCWICGLWKPTAAEVITRTVPVKREVRRKVPAATRTVEERCRTCRHDPEPTCRAVDPARSEAEQEEAAAEDGSTKTGP